MGLKNFKEVLLIKDYRHLWIAQMFAGLGSSFYFVALMWLVWESTQSTLHSGLLAIFFEIPQLALGLWIGVLISRFSLRNVLIFSDIMRAIGAITVLILFFLDIFSIHVLFAAVVLEGLMLSINRPASNAILPQIVKNDKLETANATSQLSNRMVNVAGYGAAGVIIALIGAVFSIVTFAISFLASALFVSRIKNIPKPQKKRSSISKDFKEGFVYLKKEPPLLIIFSIGILMNVGGAPITVLGPAYSQMIAGAGSVGYGFIQAAWLSGIAIGALYIGSRKTKRLWVALSIGFFIQGVAQFAFGLSNHVVLSVIFICIHGFFMSVANIPLFTFVQRYVPKEKLPHVFSILGTLVMAVNPLAFAASGFLAESIGIRESYIAGATLTFLATALIALPPWLKSADKKITEEVLTS